MATLIQFTPTITENFSFLPTLDGQQYAATVYWSLFGQRWILSLYTLQNVLVVQKPLTASPDDYDINLVAGYFKNSTLIYRDSTNNFEINP
jgi:hypothetical protein